MRADAGAATPTVKADADMSHGKEAQATEPAAPNAEAKTGGAKALGQDRAEEGAIGAAPASLVGGQGYDPTADPLEQTELAKRRQATSASKSCWKGVSAWGTYAAAAAADPDPGAPKSNGVTAQAEKPKDDGTNAPESNEATII